MGELLLKKKAQPTWLAPMLATLSYEPFSDATWIFEHKLDGMRCLLFKKGTQIKIYSRNKKLQNNSYPELVQALLKLPGDFILDSEVVVFNGKITSFEALQARMHVKDPSKVLQKKVPIYAYVFDILYLNGYNLCDLQLIERKKILLHTFKFKDPLRHLEYTVGVGEKLLTKVCKMGLEGLIAKHATSKYEHKRSKNWLKLKCSKGQELVIGGYTKPTGSRTHFGALLLGYYENGKFIYAGKVGTGFDQDLLKLLYAKMSKITRTTSPFSNYDPRTKNTTWIEPKLVAQLRFTEWTTSGHLRHPSFLGLRTDKAPEKVTRE